MAITAPFLSSVLSGSPAPLAVDVTIDSTTWAALAVVLTVVGAALTWVSWRRRGPAAGLRALAWTLIPVAAWLTGTLRLAAAVVGDVLTWATRLVFSPVVWSGVVVAGVAAMLWVVSGRMLARGIGVRGTPRTRRGRAAQVPGAPAAGAPSAVAAAPKGGRRGAKADRSEDIEGMDDIEAILKKHGI